MALSTKEAAAAAGVSRQAISRAIQEGRLSAMRSLDGSWQVDPVELQRVYPPHTGNGATLHPEIDEDCAGLRKELQTLRELVTAQDATILDLRTRLDHATEEVTKLTAVLTSQLAPPVPAPRPGFWRRLLRG